MEVEFGELGRGGPLTAHPAQLIREDLRRAARGLNDEHMSGTARI